MAFVKRLFDYQWGKMLHNTHRNDEAATGHKLIDSRACGYTGHIVKILVRNGTVYIRELIVGPHRVDIPGNRRTAASAAQSITLPAGYSAEDDYYNTCWISITKGHGRGQMRQITDYNGTTRVCTLDRAWSYPPGVGSWFKIIEGRSVLDDYELRGIALNPGDAVICRNVPFGSVSIDATAGSAWIFYKETKIPDPPGGRSQCNTSTSTTSTTTTTNTSSSTTTSTTTTQGIL